MMLAAIIQARLGSSRLPGKALADVAGKPMLERLVERVRASRHVEEIVIATTEKPQDEALVEFARKQELKVMRGSETDVLDRFYQAAKTFGVKTIVRVTPDCPLMDPEIIDQVVELFRSGEFDYASNTMGKRFPDGMDVEVFSFEALERAHRETEVASDREHVTPYIKASGKFRIAALEASEDLSNLKWSVDHEVDLAFARAVYARLGSNGHHFGMEDILALVRKSPELAALNQSSISEEGYFKSFLDDAPVPEIKRKLTASALWAERAAQVVPGGSQTLSKGPTQFVQGVAPCFLVRGKGARVWDLDDNEYLDVAMALGPVILGYSDAEVNAAVAQQLDSGVIFSLPHPLEVELSELLRDLIPCAEMVRFGKNGSDVTTGAVRLARAVTGRPAIATCGYHGWQDWTIGTTTRRRGVPEAVRELTFAFEYNRLESLERIFSEHVGQVAAVILEPVGIEAPQAGFLEGVKALAEREGAILIFDEVLTGFRFDLGGAQKRFGVTPDLACFGKAMANGFPLSALVGRRELMRHFEEVFFSFTFGGEVLSLAAAKATLERMIRGNVVAQLWASGNRFQAGYNALARHCGLESLTACVGFAPRTVVQFHAQDEAEGLALKSLFQQECVKRGVLFTGYHLPSASHSNSEVDQILRVYAAAMRIVAEASRKGEVVRRLQGKPVQPVFRTA